MIKSVAKLLNQEMAGDNCLLVTLNQGIGTIRDICCTGNLSKWLRKWKFRISASVDSKCYINNTDLGELAFGLVAKAHGSHVGGHGFKTHKVGKSSVIYTIYTGV